MEPVAHPAGLQRVWYLLLGMRGGHMGSMVEEQSKGSLQGEGEASEERRTIVSKASLQPLDGGLLLAALCRQLCERRQRLSAVPAVSTRATRAPAVVAALHLLLHG
jgi:hypothetical protein